MLPRVHPHEFRVVKRVAQPLVPRWARLVDDEERAGEHGSDHGEHEQALHETKDLITDPTNASSSSGVPMLR